MTQSCVELYACSRTQSKGINTNNKYTEEVADDFSNIHIMTGASTRVSVGRFMVGKERNVVTVFNSSPACLRMVYDIL